MGLGSSFGVTSETNNNIQTDGLVYYLDPAYKKSYPRSGTATTDLANEIGGTLNNTPTFNSDGYFTFDGAAAETISTTLPSYPTTNWSLCAWAKHADGNSGSEWDGVAMWSNSRDRQGISIAGGTYNSIAFPWTVFYGDSKYRYSYASVGTDWTHVAMCYDGSTVNFYVNGASVTLDVERGAAAGPVDDDFKIASCNDGGSPSSHTWDGSVGPVQVYHDKILSAGEVLQNYNAQKERFGY